MDLIIGNATEVELPRSIVGPSADNGIGLLSIWLVFQISSGSVFLPILVSTFLFAKTVKRHPTLINMCITWIFAGVSASLLFYARQESGPEPSKPLCIAQTSLLYGTPPMTSLSALAVVYQIWSSLGSLQRLEPRKGKATLYLTLIIPYLALVSFVIATAALATREPNKVTRSRRFFYCAFEYGKISNAMGATAAAICLVTVALEIHIAVMLSRNLRGLRNMGKSHPNWGSLDVQLAGRIFIFTGYLLIALVFSAISIMSPRTVVPDMFAATMGVAVFLVFGTQPDVLRAWAFWLPARPVSEQETSQRSREGNCLDSAFEFIAAPASGDEKHGSPLSVSSFVHTDSKLSHSSGSPTVIALGDMERGGVASRANASVTVIKRPEEAFVRSSRVARPRISLIL